MSRARKAAGGPVGRRGAPSTVRPSPSRSRAEGPPAASPRPFRPDPPFRRGEGWPRAFRLGDAVWYRQGRPGGYGFDRYVPARFVRYTTTRARILLMTSTGWSIVLIAVDAYRLSYRDEVAAVDAEAIGAHS